jgi:hypothetical protein
VKLKHFLKSIVMKDEELSRNEGLTNSNRLRICIAEG